MDILAVDDDPIILELLGHFIEAVGGHRLTTAPCAQDALAILEQKNTRFDCFLFDIQMPVMDGIALCHAVRQMPDHRQTPILMLTAMTEKRYVDAAFAAGATDYVSKPFEVSELKARLTLVDDLVALRRVNTTKVFSAQSLSDQHGQADEIVALELHEPITIFDVDNVIENNALENYVTQLSRSALFGSTTFAFSLRKIEEFHAHMSAFEFHSLIADTAEIISDTLHRHQFLMSYAGNGTFVCVTENGWRPDAETLMDAVNLSLARSELYTNNAERIYPRVSVGEVVSLVWKTGQSAMGALAEAHTSAEAASAAHTRGLTDFWLTERSA